MGRISGLKIDGVLVGDQRKDQLLLLQDRNGDGTAEGEASVFFDATNASGLQGPTNNIFSVTQARDGSVFLGDGDTDSVYRLTDLNGDGDAQDADEAVVWFSAENAGGLSTVTPNGIAEGANGAIYIANAGVSSAPQDAIYRTQDLNGDGDANDEGEATVWLDVQTLIDTAVPFDLSFDGDVAYLSDLTGTATDVIWRIEDTNGDGVIGQGEAVEFISDDMNFGAPVDISNAVAADGALYTSTWIGPDEFKVYRLQDVDGSGRIDQQYEATEVWNNKAMVGDSAAQIGFSIAVDDDGRVFLNANDFDGNTTVIALENLNGDGDFLDAGETTLFGSNAYDGQLERVRAVATYDVAAEPVAGTVGAGNHFSIFLKDGVLYASGENVVGQLGNGDIGFDVKAPRAVELAPGFDDTIKSVSAGLLHSTFLTENGDVYSFGYNNRGPLGTGDEETRTTAVKVKALDDVKVVAIENGNATSYAIADDGTLYAWGNNANGQLGLGDTESRLEPVIVNALAGKQVVAIASDVTHTLVLTASGDVYAMGSNTDNQVAGTDERRVLEPTLVEGLPKDIIAVTAAGRTSYAVTSDGRVFGWGQSDTGQLLQGTDNGDGTFTVDNADVAAPIELTAMPDGVIDVQGGARWGAALTNDGDVYVWGPNDIGPSGGLDGDPATESDGSFYPTRIATLDAINIVEIQTGPNSIIAVAEVGGIYTWGSNSDGRLGYESDGSVYEPIAVDFDGDAAPWLLSATPGDNGRDVANDSALVLKFTDEVSAGEGTVTLVNRDTGERTEIDVTDSRLIQFDGTTVTVTPPAHLDADTRYAVEISKGAFVDNADQPYSGIAEGDVSSFNFSTDEVASTDSDGNGSWRDDLLRGGADDDRLKGRGGDDILSGGDGDDQLHGGWGDDALNGGNGDDRLNGGLGNDSLYGGNGNDQLNGGWGDDLLAGGQGDDVMIGGWGNDTFVYEGGNDVIRDFDAGFDWWFISLPSETIVIDIDSIDSFDDLMETASGNSGSVTFVFDDENSLKLDGVNVAQLDSDMFVFA